MCECVCVCVCVCDCVCVCVCVIGPWYVGELLEGVYGLVFVHGIAVNGYFISGSLTYLAGVLEVCSVCVCVCDGYMNCVCVCVCVMAT